MDKVIKNKRDLELVNSLSLNYNISSEKFPLFIIYYLTMFDDVM